MQRIILILSFILIITFINADTNIPSGNVYGTWELENSPYNILGNILIQEEDSLFVESGVEVIFQDHYSFIIEGCLIAVGIESNLITFTINDTLGFSNPNTTEGSWNGFSFDSQSNTTAAQSVLSFCDISYSKKIGLPPQSRSGAIYISYYSSVVLTHNKIHHNIGSYGGAIKTKEQTYIAYNYITDNYSTERGGGISSGSGAIIINNVIANNRAESGGGGLYLYGNDIICCNNTVTNNHSENGNSLFVMCYDPLSFYNNIFWGALEDGAQIYVNSVESITNFYNCDIAGGLENFSGDSGFSFTGEYENNINAEPGFINSGLYPYSLSSESYCVNLGNSQESSTDLQILEFDLAGNSRIYDDEINEIDIGAYELQEESLVVLYPSISPNGSIFSSPQFIVLETNTNDALIYYTTDSSEPTQNSYLYTNPFLISESSTVKAKAFKDNHLASLTRETNFIFGNTLEGDISGNLTLVNSPYYVIDSLRIIENETLIIESGVEIYFADNYKFKVIGSLFAQGTENDSILFTALDRNVGWTGFYFDETAYNQEAVFEHCIFSYTKNLEENEDYGGAIYVKNFSNLIIQNCTFNNNLAKYGGAIYLNNSSITIKNCLIKNNTAYVSGGGIHCYNHSNALIENNKIIYNNGGNYGGGLKSNDSGGNIVNNWICNNYADTGGGISTDSDYDQPQPKFIGNVICNNSSRYDGAAMYMQYFSNPQITNCTIAFNFCTNTYDPNAICIYYNSNPHFQNTVLWNPDIDEIEIYTGVASNPSFNYCIFQDWSDEFNGNHIFDENPLFEESSDIFSFAVTDSSPCIDAGNPNVYGLELPPNDIINNIRIWDGDNDGIEIVDIGAYEYDSPIYVDADDNAFVLESNAVLNQNYPNPFNPQTTISFLITEKSKIELSVYNIKGQKVKSLVNNDLDRGNHSVVWSGIDESGKSVSSGIYFYKLNVNGELKSVKKCLMLK